MNRLLCVVCCVFEFVCVVCALVASGVIANPRFVPDSREEKSSVPSVIIDGGMGKGKEGRRKEGRRKEEGGRRHCE